MTQQELALHISRIKDAIGRVDGHLTAFVSVYENEIGSAEDWNQTLRDSLAAARESADALLSAIPAVELVLSPAGQEVEELNLSVDDPRW